MTAPQRITGDRALLRFLARQGRITAEDVARVEKLLAEQADATVHDVLERENIISQKDLATLLANTLRLRSIDLTSFPLDANVTRELKENIATRYEVVPIAVDDRSIEVVTANPLDLEGLKAVEFATGKRVQAVVATHVEVQDALKHTYRLQESLEQFLQLVPAGEALVVNELNDDGADLRTVAADAELPPVIKLADKMLIEGIKTRASDIHLEPGTDSVLVRYRVDGILEEAFRFPKWIQNPLVARLKVMAKLDITERRLPQDGRIQVRFGDKTVDMRVSSLPAQHGEKITLRILDASQAVKALDRLGFTVPDLKVIREAAKKPQGMILITGPTGSGKTTTLYALLRDIFSPKTNIVTIENPIEYQLKGVNQVEVNEKQGLTFGGVLRSVLRQDPDVILVGEIRDKETAQIAFQAASTGHLVLSTVHTNDAAGAVTRLLDLGLEPYAVASALNLVVAQRLVRQLCPNCSTATTIDDETRRQLHLGDADGNFKRAVGCAQCRHTGYRSRAGLYEMLPMTPAIVKLIEAGAGESMVRQQARTDGLHTLLEDAVDKVRAGQSTVEELQRVVQITDAGGTQCPGCQKEIAEDYSVCPHCSKVLRATCVGCSKPLSPEWVRCPYCGSAAGDDAVIDGSAPAERRSFKALVVDDTATIRDVVQHTLEHSDLDLTVMTADNGPAALEIASRERPDIVILDISMPEMDGFEVCRRLRSEMRTAFVPVLMLTAHDSEDDVAKGFGVGADDYMVKPFRREGLLARVRRILERTYGAQALPPAAGTPDPLPAARPSPSAGVTAGAAPPAPSYPTPPPRDAAAADVTAALAQLASDRDKLRHAVETCELRLGEIAADRAVTGGAAAAAIDVLPAVAELRALVSEMQGAQERAFAELRAEAAHARTVAEDALRRAAAGPAPGVDPQVTAMLATVEQLQSEQTRLVGMVAAAGTGEPGSNEECERRLRQATQEIGELRSGIAELQTAWQREAQQLRTETQAAWQHAAQELRDQDRGEAERARRRVEERATAAIERAASADDKTTTAIGSLRQELAALRDELDAQRADLGREGTRVRAAEERAERVQVDALGAAEKSSREVSAVQRTLADQQEQRQQDMQRLAAAEESARRAHAEVSATTEHLAEQLAAMRRTVGEQRDGGTQLAAQIAANMAAMDATARESKSDLQAIARSVDDEIAALKKSLGEQRAGGTELHGRVAALDAAAREVRAEIGAIAGRLSGEIAELKQAIGEQRAGGTDMQDRVAAVDAAAREVRAEIGAIACRLTGEITELRDAVAREQSTHADDERRFAAIEAATRQSAEATAATEAAVRAVSADALAVTERVGHELAAIRQQNDTQQAAIDWTEGRLGQARRVVVKLVQRVREIATAYEARAEAREAECHRELAVVRAETTATLDTLREQHGALAARMETRLAELPSAAEQHALQAFLDACETRFGELAARLDAQGAPAPAGDDQSRARLTTQLAELITVTERLDAEQRRLAADVEERLRALMRTAAGGFDVQLALLRGKVEMLTRTMRERGAIDPEAPLADSMLEHRHGLLERLRQQLVALQSGTDWRPQRVLDLLIDSTLAAAVTPFRRMLQLAESATGGAEAPRPAPSTTDESAAPSLDP